MNTNELAYLAGIFDGEGTVCVCKRKAYGAYLTPRYTLLVAIQLGELSTIEFLSKITNKHFIHIKPVGNRRKISYRLTWSSNQGAEFLRQIIPYLHGKKEQAILAVEFQEQTSSQSRGIPLTEDQLALRETFYLQLRLLKTSTC